ncbi:MAG TPA: helix-turn-helix transcriptional regulator [Bdellovibrio sp.]
MIKTEKEYQESKKLLDVEFKELDVHAKNMKKAGLSRAQIKLALDPMSSFALQLQEEVEAYEKLKKGQFEPLENLNGIGRTLIALRIFKSLKQKELAEKLQVTEAQVSRDERNEYHGASIEKIQKVLDAMGVTLKSVIKIGYDDAG